MENQFVPYELALKLKKLGFDEGCFGEYRQWDGSDPYLKLYQEVYDSSTDPSDYEYTTECYAPLWQQAFDWFREKHDVTSWVYINDNIFQYNVNFGFGIHVFKKFYSFEEARLECLKKLIEIVEKQNQS